MTKAFMKKDLPEVKNPIEKKSKPCCKNTLLALSQKKCACKDLKTEIIAEYDVGFGNSMFIRGEGCKCLSWDHGVAMTNVGANKWKFECVCEGTEIEFKLLINDEFWSAGENMKAEREKINHLLAKF